MAWVNPPSKFKKTVEKDLNKHTKRIALKLLRLLVVESPVDTGRFNINWLVGLKEKDPRVLEEIDKSKSVAVTRGKAVIKKHKTFDLIWISNNLPYAKALNQGHSQQAPANFVEKGIARVLKP